MTAVTTISINNEADAWALLESAIKDLLPDETIQLAMGDWPEIHLKFSGAKFNSTITTTMMEAFIDLQKNIYRLYAKLQYDEARSILLTDDDRRALNIFVQISPGSTEATIDLKDAFKKLVEGAINKMEAKHFVILAMIGAISYSTNTMWKDYLHSQNETKKAELQVALTREESRRLQIFADATKLVPHANTLAIDANEFRNKILKSAKAADSIVVAGQNISREQATNLVRNTRSQSEEVRLDGEYRIVKVDSSNPDHFKVFLVDKNGKGFPAILDDQTITKAKNRELLQEAEWEKKTIRLMINGTQVRGDVTSARIIDVTDRFSPDRSKTE